MVVEILEYIVNLHLLNKRRRLSNEKGKCPDIMVSTYVVRIYRIVFDCHILLSNIKSGGGELEAERRTFFHLYGWLWETGLVREILRNGYQHLIIKALVNQTMTNVASFVACTICL